MTKIDNSTKVCCIFDHKDAQEAILNFDRKIVKDLGDRVYNNDGSVKHRTHMWSTGGRVVVSCTNCGALFLYQCSEYDGYNSGNPDMDYEDYFLVKSLQEAIELNNKYGVPDLEFNFKGLRIWNSQDGWHWNK